MARMAIALVLLVLLACRSACAQWQSRVEASALLLRQLGCDAFQDYLVSPPLETAAFEAWRASYAPRTSRPTS